MAFAAMLAVVMVLLASALMVSAVVSPITALMVVTGEVETSLILPTLIRPLESIARAPAFGGRVAMPVGAPTTTMLAVDDLPVTLMLSALVSVCVMSKR